MHVFCQVEDLRACKGDLSKLTVPIVANASAVAGSSAVTSPAAAAALLPKASTSSSSAVATAGKPYKCAQPQCDYATSNKLTIYEHCQKKHAMKGSVNDIQVVGTEPQWKCFICSLECASFFSLLYHHMRHLKLKPFLCKHCNFANVKKGNLYDHCENIHRIKGGSDEDMIEIDQDQFAQVSVIYFLRIGHDSSFRHGFVHFV